MIAKWVQRSKHGDITVCATTACLRDYRVDRRKRLSHLGPQLALLWGRIVSCAPVFNRRWSACLQAIRAGYPPAAGCQPAPQFLADARFWENYMALGASACRPISSRSVQGADAQLLMTRCLATLAAAGMYPVAQAIAGRPQGGAPWKWLSAAWAFPPAHTTAYSRWRAPSPIWVEWKASWPSTWRKRCSIAAWIETIGRDRCWRRHERDVTNPRSASGASGSPNNAHRFVGLNQSSDFSASAFNTVC
jgi:hypothetical protein